MKNPLRFLVFVALNFLPQVLPQEIFAQDHRYCIFAEQKKLYGIHQNEWRPPVATSLKSTLFALTVHAQEGVDAQYAKAVLAAAETSYRHLILELGFKAPLQDGLLGGDAGFDIYIVTSLKKGIGGYTGFTGFEPQAPHAVGFVVLSHEVDARLLRGVVAHEFFHAVQMGYNYFEEISLMEATAVWASEQVFDDEDQVWKYFPFFNSQPFLSLNFVKLEDGFMYGAGLFATYLEERFNGGYPGSVIRSLWESSWYEQDPTKSQPGMVRLLDQRFLLQGGAGELLREFGQWRTLLGSRKKYGLFKEVSLWDNRVDPYFEIEFNGNIDQGATITGSSKKPLFAFSQALFSLKPESSLGQKQDFEISFKTKGEGPFALDLLLRQKDQAFKRVKGPMVQGGQDELSTLSMKIEALTDVEELVLIFSNLKPPRLDAPPSSTSFDYQMLIRPEAGVGE